MARLTPQEIRETEFKQAALGYNKEHVHQFLDSIATELEALIQESNELHVENKEARLTLKTYMDVENSLKETLLLAQKTGQDTIRSAQKEADIILRKATTEKDALLFSAKEDLSGVQHEILNLRTTRESMLIKLKSILRSDLELLESQFPEDGGSHNLEQNYPALPNERIIDFSQTDLVVEDLPSETDSPEISTDEAETFEGI